MLNLSKVFKFVLPLTVVAIILGIFWYLDSGLIDINGTEAYIATPDDFDESKTYPVVMAIHGNGRSAASYNESSSESVDFYTHQADIATSEGFIFTVISNDDDTWGTDQGLENLYSLYNYIQENYNVEETWTLWSTSAGGLQMNRFIREYPHLVEKAIGTFPVYDLEDMLAHNNTAKEVWADMSIENINPANYPEALIDIPMLIFHGKDDVVVPPEQHSQRLADDLSLLGGNITIHLVEGGHSTDNFNVYDDNIIRDFLNE